MKKEKYIASANNSLKFKLFQLWQLPASWFMGISVRSLTEEKCEVRLPYGWRSQNPFRSIYFAAQTAAGEMATGLLAQAHLQEQPPVSMLVTRVEAEFFKKAADTLIFTCDEGATVAQIIEKCVADSQARELKMTAIGTLPDGVVASKISIHWSFRLKK